MFRSYVRVTAFLIIAGILAAFSLWAPSAHAAPARPAPMGGLIGNHPLSGVHPNGGGGGGNILLSGDIVIGVVDNVASPTRTVIAAEGWIQLAPKGAGYAGTFTDNMGNGKVYPVSATGIGTSSPDGTYTINAFSGKFVVTVSGNGNNFSGTAPTKFGGLTPILQGYAHAYTVNPSLNATFAQTSIGYMPVTSGILSLVTDANHIIVPFNKAHGINSSFAYFSGGHASIAPITSFGQYIPVTGSGSGNMTLIVKIGKTTFNIYDASEDDSGTPFISGVAMGGSGAQAILTTFTAK